MKLVVLTNILAPYRNPLFAAMAKLTNDFTVVLMADDEPNRLWSMDPPAFRTIVLPGVHVRMPGAETPAHVNFRVVRTLRELDPDVVLSGGFTVANVSALRYCRRYGKRFVQWASLTLRDGAQTSPLMRLLRRILSSQADGCVSESSESASTFALYGMAPQRITTVLVPFEVGELRDRVSRFRAGEESRRLRATMSGPVLLSVGQLIPRKGYPELFAIYRELLKQRPDAYLLIVGDGASRLEYEAMVNQSGWTQVRFVGFVQAEALGRYFAMSDLFVFHTRYDCYGLVTAEAMAASVPVVASVHAASTHDLVEDGVTGFRIDPFDTWQSVQQILRALSMEPLARAAMIDAALQRVASCDVAPSAGRIVSFLVQSAGGYKPAGTPAHVTRVQ